jgi:hypothetical protein
MNLARSSAESANHVPGRSVSHAPWLQTLTCTHHADVGLPFCAS